jgi:hypothetical protein
VNIRHVGGEARTRIACRGGPPSRAWARTPCTALAPCVYSHHANRYINNAHNIPHTKLTSRQPAHS